MLLFNTPLRNSSEKLDDALLCDLTNICDTQKDVSINCIGSNINNRTINVRFTRHDYYLIYVIDGLMHLEIEDISTDVTTGNLIIISPETEYFYCTKKDTFVSYLSVHITGSKAAEFIEGFSLPTNKILNCGYISNMNNYWTRLQREFILYDEFFDRTTVAILTQILARFSRAVNSTDTNNFLAQSVTYMNENFHKKISIGYLAELEGLSESYYRSVFKQIFKKTPSEHITTLRLSAAAGYLENSTKSLSEIASLVGYSDEFYMGKMFKKEFGISPGKYRRMNKE